MKWETKFRDCVGIIRDRVRITVVIRSHTPAF